jgi:NADH dehydrogenase FAD-containing subunit
MPETTSLHDRHSSPRIVIVGAGFGGLAAAKGLRKAAAQVVLIDQRNHHLFQPMLYQVAMGQLRPGDIAEPLRQLFGDDPVVAPRMDAVDAVDLDARNVGLVSGQHLDYDMLVLATGARFQYLGHPQWERHVLRLKNLTQAMAMREQVFFALERAARAPDAEERQARMSFVIVGAGPTGVEVAGALARLLPGIIRKQFPNLDADQLRIVLIDPKPRALSSMHESLGRYADQSLKARGVTLMTGAAVDDIRAGQVQVKGGQCIRAATIIWAAGMEGNGAGDWLPAALVDKHNQVPVGADLTVPNHPEVFVIGDAAAATDEDGNPYPGLASVAKQQGDYVARVIRERLAEAPAHPPARFHFTDYGTMAMIANGCAVAEIRGHNLKGFFAWLLWGIVHLHFLVSSRKRVLVLASWFWAMLADRSQRVILNSVPRSREHVSAALDEGDEKLRGNPRDEDECAD